MLSALLVFFWCPLNYDVAFKITNKLKVNNDNFKFNGDFKNYIAIEMILREY
jgi:glutathione peroxidase-family protein